METVMNSFFCLQLEYIITGFQASDKIGIERFTHDRTLMIEVHSKKRARPAEEA